MPSKKGKPGSGLAESASPQLVFLAGPSGSGKSALGHRVCEELAITFLDLSAPAPSADDPGTGRKELGAAITSYSADVIALSWSLQQDSKALNLARRSGELILLWAHPLEMQKRSGHTESLFTPVGRLKTRGGFGRNGTACREFRRLDRACPETLLLVGTPLDKAVQELRELIKAIRKEADLSPAEREGLVSWIDQWRDDYDADIEAARILVDAMARYTLHLRHKGTAPRALNKIYPDLQAAGMLVFCYDAPRGQDVLDHFWSPPRESKFQWKFTDSPRLVARYRRNLEGFARFLRQQNLIEDD